MWLEMQLYVTKDLRQIKVLLCRLSFRCGRGGIGRHARLKILFLYRSAGSIPAARTNFSICFAKNLIQWIKFRKVPKSYALRVERSFTNQPIQTVSNIKVNEPQRPAFEQSTHLYNYQSAIQKYINSHHH